LFDSFGTDADVYRNASLAKSPQTLTGNLRVRVLDGDHNALYTRIYQRHNTWSSPALMAARFKGDVSRSALSSSLAVSVKGHFERLDLGVGVTGGLCKTLTENRTLLDEHTADRRIRR